MFVLVCIADFGKMLSRLCRVFKTRKKLPLGKNKTIIALFHDFQKPYLLGDFHEGNHADKGML